jgi:magnesium transporter
MVSTPLLGSLRVIDRKRLCLIFRLNRFLDSLIFNDEVDSYKSWTLFLIFVSMLILISGVVLLTHKKPEPAAIPPGSASVAPMLRGSSSRGGTAHRPGRKKAISRAGEHEDDGTEDGRDDSGVLWAIGEESDDEDESPLQQLPRPRQGKIGSGTGRGRGRGRGEERIGLIAQGEGENDVRGRTTDEDATLRRNDDHDLLRDEADEFGEWEDASIGPAKGKGLG